MPFTFKQFFVDDNRSALKVGTDAVLLGAWADAAGCTTILDAGTGCGIIALMLAQRFQARIHAIDIDPGSIEDARENFSRSPWSDRLSSEVADLRKYPAEHSGQYDLIVCNPPFYSNQLKSPSREKNISKHDNSLNFMEFLVAAERLLNRSGRISVILPWEAHSEFNILAMGTGFHIWRETPVQTQAGKDDGRILLEYGLASPVSIRRSNLTIRDTNGNYTDAYKMLTGAFYLKF